MVLQLACLELHGFIQDFVRGGGLDTSEIAFPEKKRDLWDCTSDLFWAKISANRFMIKKYIN